MQSLLRRSCAPIRQHLCAKHAVRSFARRLASQCEHAFIAPSDDAMAHLAEIVADGAKAGDCVLFYGDVGAGKSVFSRAYIRCLANDPSLPVPSPTYLLQNMYDSQHGGPPVHHFDLYRLGERQDFGRLSLDHSFRTAVCLIEWAERLGTQLPEAHLKVHIKIIRSSEQQQIEKQFGGQLHVGNDASEEEEDNPYTDRRWRWVHLSAVGASWEQRLRGFLAAVSQEGRQTGLNYIDKSCKS